MSSLVMTTREDRFLKPCLGECPINLTNDHFSAPEPVSDRGINAPMQSWLYASTIVPSCNRSPFDARWTL